jgi:hypothetical protein
MSYPRAGAIAKVIAVRGREFDKGAASQLKVESRSEWGAWRTSPSPVSGAPRSAAVLGFRDGYCPCDIIVAAEKRQTLISGLCDGRAGVWFGARSRAARRLRRYGQVFASPLIFRKNWLRGCAGDAGFVAGL